MRRLMAFFLAMVMVLSLLAGCGSSGSSKTEEEILSESDNMLEGREMATSYQTYFTSSYSSLNYFSTSYATVREIVGNCVDGLVEPDKYGVYVSSLADSWDHNDDSTVGDSNDGPFNYDIYFDSLSTGYADPSGILTRIGTEEVENVGAYIVPEFDDLIDKALNAATFDERLQYFAEAEAFLLEGAYMIPVMSSLRGYHMTCEVPYSAPYMLYGNVRYKGMQVLAEPLTLEEYQIKTAAWEIERAAALAAQE